MTRALTRRRLRAWILVLVFLGVAGAACSPEEVLEPPQLPAPTSTTPSTVPPETIPKPTEDPDVVTLGIGDDFSAVVGDAPEGTHFIVAAGIHRLHEVKPKNGMTFEGAPGAVMSGAVHLPDWVRESDGVWSSDGIEKTAFEHGVCITNYEGCRLSQDLYMDDVMLWQVTERKDVTSGTWFWDGATILVGDDPTMRRVELSMATYAFYGDASDVTIRDLIVEKYAVPAQFGAIQSEEHGGGNHGSGWLVEDVELRLNHGAGVRMGDNTTLRRLLVHHNGQMGLAASGGSGGLVEDCEIHDNNLAGFSWGWEAGGAKFKETTGLVVRGNFVHDNGGPGLWTDIDNVDTLYEDNVATGNAGPGIFHEISYSAVIRNNTVRENGYDLKRWLWGSGILIAASQDVEVFGNVVEDNANGIGLIQQDRGSGAYGEWIVRNVHVFDNVIKGGRSGAVQDIGDDAIFDADNWFQGNSYTGNVRWAWKNHTRLQWLGWQATGNDTEGTLQP